MRGVRRSRHQNDAELKVQVKQAVVCGEENELLCVRFYTHTHRPLACMRIRIDLFSERQHLLESLVPQRPSALVLQHQSNFVQLYHVCLVHESQLYNTVVVVYYVGDDSTSRVEIL